MKRLAIKYSTLATLLIALAGPANADRIDCDGNGDAVQKACSAGDNHSNQQGNWLDAWFGKGGQSGQLDKNDLFAKFLEVGTNSGGQAHGLAGFGSMFGQGAGQQKNDNGKNFGNWFGGNDADIGALVHALLSHLGDIFCPDDHGGSKPDDNGNNGNVSVPEPGTLVLLGAGLLLIVIGRRKLRKR